MKRLREWILRIGGLFNKQRKDREFDQEIESHLQLHIEENLRLGMTPEQARRDALIKLGGIESMKEAYRDQRGLPVLETLWQDIRYGARMLRKNPGFTAVAVLTLALGIGANTAIFSFVNAVLFRPLPLKDSERLVMVFKRDLGKDLHKVPVVAPALDQWRRQGNAFEGLAARSGDGFVLTGKDQPETIRGSRFSANICQLLGIRPFLGRGFLPEEETYGKDHVVLLTHELWQRRFGGDTNVIGQSITLSDEPYTVIGVLPPRLFFPDRYTQLWAPLAFSPDQLRDYGSHNYLVYGRLKPGISVVEANAEMSVVSQRLAAADEHYKGAGAEVFSLQETMIGDSRTVLLALLGAVGLVLLIGCVNIANLLLARSAARAREFAIRAALGAGRWATVRQLLTENLLMALLGGAAAIIVGEFGLRLLVRLIPPDLPRVWEGIGLDVRTLGFTALITLAAGFLFGLVPALQVSRPAVARELKESSRGSVGGQQRLRASLVVGEVALSLMLLMGAGLMMRSFSRLISQPLGYNPEHVITMDLGLTQRKYPTLGDQIRFFGQLKERTEALPGVQSVALVRGLPLSGQNTGMGIVIPGAPPLATGESSISDYAQVSPGYFHTMNIPVLQGRDFNEQDRTNSIPVTIVNESFVQKFNLGTNVLGQLISFGGSTNEIVGVVKDTKRENLARLQRGAVYRPYQQQCWGFLSLIIRTQRDPAEISRAVRSELDSIDKYQTMENIRTMTELVASSVADRRLPLRLFNIFAGAALLLAALGLYGVLAFNVTQRTREIGIRMALGAQSHDVLTLVIAHGIKLAVVGIVLGIGATLALTRVIERLLYETRPADPFTLVGVSGLLMCVALVACWIPARRAAMVDPMIALRHE